MATLNEEVKLYIVQCLACYDTPSTVAYAVAEEFGITVDRSQVGKYDPTKVNGKDVSKKLKAVFEATRKAFLDETIQIPIASKVYRLRSLQRMHDYYVAKKNFVQAQAILEQAAKEVGNVFTNKQLLGNDAENPLMLFYKQISGNTLPVIHDEEIFEGEVVSFDAPPETEPKPKPAAIKVQRTVLERD